MLCACCPCVRFWEMVLQSLLHLLKENAIDRYVENVLSSKCSNKEDESIIPWYCLLSDSRWFLAWPILRPWRWRGRVSPKLPLTFNGLHAVVSHIIERFIATSVRTSNHTVMLLTLEQRPRGIGGLILTRRVTGVEQNNGNTTYTVHISLLLWCLTTVSVNTAAILLAVDSYKFWTVSSGILYHSSWRTSSSCFRDVGHDDRLVVFELRNSLTPVNNTNLSHQWNCRCLSSQFGIWCT
jgi:hypothetical protein